VGGRLLGYGFWVLGVRDVGFGMLGCWDVGCSVTVLFYAQWVLGGVAVLDLRLLRLRKALGAVMIFKFSSLLRTRCEHRGWQLSIVVKKNTFATL